MHAAPTRTASGLLAWLTAATFMTVAMMGPVFAFTLDALRARVLQRRQLLAQATATIGYFAVWLGATAAIEVTTSAVHSGRQGNWSRTIVFVFAALWQLTALKRRALVECHSERATRLSGKGALIDEVRFGATSGLWCVASCWAMMTAAYMVMTLPTMALLSVLIVGERLANRPVTAARVNASIFGLIAIALAVFR